MPARIDPIEHAPLAMDATLSILNPVPTLLPGPSLLHELVSGPEHDGTALEYFDAEGHGQYYSYSELHRRAEKLASYLREQQRLSSRPRSSIVPVYISQCPSLYISILAILKAGGAFCPLNLDVPEERLNFILKDTSAQFILTTSDLRSKLPNVGDVSIIVVDELAEVDDTATSAAPEDGPQDEHPLAYIMYTSGSTGLPKAVCLSHKAVTQSLLAHDRHIPTFTRFLQFASPTFDVSVFEIFFPWIRGVTLVTCDRSRLLGDLPGMITEMNIDAAELTPSVAASLVRKRENVPTLKTLLTIGEMLNLQVINEFGGSETQSSMLYGMYGPTEAAIHCTLQPSFQCSMPAGTIGIPLDTVSCFVVTPAVSPERANEMEVLPIGEIGELAVGGHQLADGYLNRDEQTRAAFVSHPKFGPLYRTGDKARLLPSGVLECHGRISSGQVKLRGQRIELGEIEHAASNVPGCHAVVASVINGILVVFCIADQKEVSVEDVDAACRKWLPKYMVPNDYVILDDFPYLPSGKTDKKKLESDYKARATDTPPSDTEMSEDVRRIVETMRRVLQTEVSPSTDLGAAGLDSLKAISIASELRKQGFSQLGALDLLSARTALDLEKIAQSNKPSETAISENARSVGEIFAELKAAVLQEPLLQSNKHVVEDVLPCTPLQEAMLSETLRNPQAYCNSFKLKIHSSAGSDVLQTSIVALAQKHPSLRSGFCMSGTATSTYAQIVFEALDLSNVALVEAFSDDFSIQNASDLLRPLQVQIVSCPAGFEVLFQVHHALYDQWSIEVLLEDLESLLQQREVVDRPSFRSVSEYFVAQKLSSAHSADSLDFWQDYLSEAPPGRLPNLSEISVPAASLEVAQQSIDLDLETLRKAARGCSCSPHVLIQGVYAYLLSLYMGAEDVVFGTVVSGRTLPIADIENIIGPILGTLPTRSNFSEARKFTDILRKLHADNREIMRNSTVSLADIRKVTSVSPGEGLFDSIFVWQETARSPERALEQVELVDARDYLEFNLTLELEPTKDSINVKATYQPSVLPRPHIEKFLQQLAALSKHVAEHPETLLQNLPGCLPDSLLSIANPEPTFFEYDVGLGGVVAKQAAENPDALALCFARTIDGDNVDVESMTYEELNDRSNRLAHLLISNGTLPDELVCICMEKSLDLYVSILATVKAGAGYLPLVPETPAARIQQILSDASVKTCLVDRLTEDTISAMGVGEVINVPSRDLSNFDCNNPEVAFTPSNLAYAVFTSGTTGRPKGVLVTQENMLSNLTTLGHIYPVTQGSRMLQACNQAFDVSVFEIFFSWYAGMCLCSAVKDVLFRDLEDAINQLSITHLSLTPTVAALVNPVNVPKVRFLVTAGEAVTPLVHRAWAGKGLYQGYGPSETTNICTVNPAVRGEHVINNIGPPFENTSAFVLANTSDFSPVPFGGLGELCFGGQQVFRGYQNMPELTSSKIIDHPKYGRVYRSGDLGRLLPNGTILIQGRIDDQRKLRGQRIELGEIGSCLLQMSHVQDCDIQIIGKTKQQERLVAFWVPKNRATGSYAIISADDEVRKDIDAMFTTLCERLPVYMVPSFLIPVTSVPMTHQTKVDRRRLVSDVSELSSEALDRYAQASGSDTDSAELSATEAAAVDALASVLELDASSIRRTTSFFTLGLDSVSAIRFARAIKTHLSCQLDVSEILKRPSIARISALIEERLSKTDHAGDVEDAQSSIDEAVGSELKEQICRTFTQRGCQVRGVLPCTPLQEAMLSASSAEGNNAYYNRTVFRVSCDITRLKGAWETVLRRQDMLRTAFSSTEDSRFPFVQIVLEDFALPWSTVEAAVDDPLTLLDGRVEDQEAVRDAFAPPYKLTVVQSSQDSFLLLEMHHALYDGNAMSNLLHEVEAAYHGVELPQPVDFTSFLSYMLSRDVTKADQYFDDQLAGFVPRPFPRASTNQEAGFTIARAVMSVPHPVIDDFLKRHSVSMLSLVQATWAKVLSLSQNAEDVCFGNIVSGRSVPVNGVDALVAPCFNTLPLRVDTGKRASNIALIKALHKVNVDNMPYQLTPLRRIQARNATRGARLFDSLVLLQQQESPLDGAVWNFLGETGEMNFPCIAEIVPGSDTFELHLHFDKSYLQNDNENFAGRVCEAFVSAFDACVRYPSSDVSDLLGFDKASLKGALQPDQKYLDMLKSEKDGSSARRPDENWSRTELEIREAFAKISGTPESQIDRDTTIYRIGLDSINAIQIASRLRKKGLPLNAGDIMENPSCFQLASVVHTREQTPVTTTPAFDLDAFNQRHLSAAAVANGVPVNDVVAIRPCTAVQAGMLSQFLHSKGQQYFNHMFFAIDADCDDARLASAWSQVAQQHEMLRTGFVELDDRVHSFAMLTYKQLGTDCNRVQYEATNAANTDFVAREESATATVLGTLHQPVWRWDAFDAAGQRCLQFSALHAIFDAETLRMIQDDLRTALAGDSIPVREHIDSGLGVILSHNLSEVKEQQEFWAQQLENAAITRFPNLNPVRAGEKRIEAVNSICGISRAELEKRCRDSGVSMQAVGQAAWARLLAAYTGETRVTFGVVLSGRTTPETARCPFPCITTIPVCSDTSGNNEQVLQALMVYNASIQKHQFTPLTDIQRFAGFPSEALFDSLFAYQKPLSEQAGSKPWELLHEQATADYAVSIEMEALPEDKLGLRLTLDSNLVPMQQGTIMLKQLESLISAILGDPSPMAHENLSIVPAKDPVLPTEFAYLHDMVNATVVEHPDRIALEFVSGIDLGQVISRKWTYSQLDQESNRIANYLLMNGARAGDVVATSFDKCPEASFAFAGILKAGCAFCAIDPTAPTARKAFILEDSNAITLLTYSDVATELQGNTSCKVVDLATLKDDASLSDSPVPTPALSPSSVCYLLYTSGTTGTPKGCELTHDNAVQAMLAFQRLFTGRWTSESRWLQFASYHFDVSVLEQFWTWSVGVRLVCAPRDLILEDLAGFIDTMQITHLDLTPSLGRLLDPATVPSLHQGVFITGGEAVKQDIIDAWGNVGCLFNFYGPTECTIGVTTFPSVPCEGKPSNIGWQFDNVGTFVLAPGTQEPVLHGAVGELCISGRLVGKGYLNRPELTEECFPQLEAFGERIYRTGDLVRLLHDNSLDFQGRKDNQVKLRGQRLEIDEIEAVVRACSGIQDVVCLVTKHPKQQKDQLIGFIAMTPDRKQCQPALCPPSETRELVQMARSACEERLPGYMVPTHFIPVQTIPLSVNNKVEEKLLRQLYNSLSVSVIQEYAAQTEDDQPLSEVGQKVVNVLADLLDVNASEIRSSSNIFALGLSSISAIQFSRRLKSEGLINAQVAVILRNPRIGNLAKALSSSSSQESSEVTAAKQSLAAFSQRFTGVAMQVLGGHIDDYDAVAPCTPLQQGILSRSVDSESLLYFNSFLYSVQNGDISKLQNAFQVALDKTQILRTVFIETDDGYIQVVKRKANLTWLTIEATSQEDARAKLDARKLKWRASNTPNFTCPFEVVVVETAQEVLLQLHMHHALYDGYSLEMLIANILQMYKLGSEPDFGRSFIDVLPYGPLRNNHGAKDFWLGHLANAHTASMPVLAESISAHDILFSTCIGGLKRAESFRKSINVTVQAIVQAAWAATLRKYYLGSIGTVVSGRSIDFDGAENVIGPLFNTIPFNPSIRSNDTWEKLVLQCHDFNVAALPFQHTPLRDIMKWCKRSPSEPLFQTLFVFQGMQQDATDTSVLHAVEDTSFEADYPLACEVEETPSGELKVTIAAKAELCDVKGAETVVKEFEQALTNIISAPRETIGASIGHQYIEASPEQQNGHAGTHLNGVEDFIWTSEALAVREEIASIASVDHSEVDEHVSIFELGLDSVDAVKLSSRLKKRGLAVAVSAIMRSQTIPRIVRSLAMTEKPTNGRKSGEILNEIEKKLCAFAKDKLPNPDTIETCLPASPMQEALISEMIKTSYDAYFNHDVLKITDGIDVAQLERAWAQVVGASPILRTGFLEIDDPNLDVTFAQVVHKPAPFQFDNVKLVGEDFTECLKSITADVAAGPMWNPHLRLGVAETPKGQYLIISIAHALYDGYSLTLLHQDVFNAYHGRFHPRPSYREILEETLDASDQDAGSFWRNFLSGATRTHLGLKDDADSQSTTYRNERISTASAQAVAAFCKQQGVTIQALCQTAFAFVLAHYVGNLDVLYGVVQAGRSSQLSEEVMFPTMNTVVMRAILHGSRREMLQYLQNAISDITQHQHFPLRKIQAACQRGLRSSEDVSKSSSDGLFDALFTYQKQPDTASEQVDDLYQSVAGASDVDYPVAVEAEVVKEQLIWRTACKSSVFTTESTMELLDRLDSVLCNVIEAPQSPTLAFENDHVSVCGLPAFKRRDAASTVTSEAPSVDEENRTQTAVWSPQETQIRQVLAQVTKTPENEISKNIALQNLGVDSINAIKIASLLRKQSLKISVSEIIKAGSIEGIVTILADRQSQPAAPATRSTQEILSQFAAETRFTPEMFGHSADDIEQILPATPGQVYVLSAWQRSKGLIFFPEFEYLLKAPVDAGDIDQAWQVLVSRNQMLRTIFAPTNDTKVPFVQLVIREAPAAFIALSEDHSGSIPFAEQPFVRLTAQKTTDGFLLRLKIHHALYDAVSLPMLMRDLEHCLFASQPLEPQGKCDDFLAICVDQDSSEKRKNFWTSYLRGSEPLSLPSSATQECENRIECFDPAVLRVDEVAIRRTGATLQSLFFAAYAKCYIALASRSNAQAEKDEVILGVYLANRSHLEDSSALAAPTLNMVPVRVRSVRSSSVMEIARQIQGDLKHIGSVENSTVGLWEIAQWTGVTVDTFVNFIKLPGAAEADGAAVEERITEVQDGRSTDKRSVLHESSRHTFQQPDGLEKNGVFDAYPRSLDIEATVSAAGELGIGVFGWEDMMSVGESEKLVAELGELVQGALA